jgi:transposase
VPALPSSILEPLWVQVSALLPTRPDTHPLGCHRPRIADRVVFDKLIQVLVFGCGYRRIADHTCSATTRRRRRDEWISAGVADQLRLVVLAAYDQLFGLELAQLAVDGCITKAPCGGQTAGPSPVDRRKQGLNARWRSRRAASRWPPCRWCTWMPASTTSPAGRCWPSVGWLVRSPPVGFQHRSRSVAGG